MIWPDLAASGRFWPQMAGFSLERRRWARRPDPVSGFERFCGCFSGHCAWNPLCFDSSIGVQISWRGLGVCCWFGGGGGVVTDWAGRGGSVRPATGDAALSRPRRALQPAIACSKLSLSHFRRAPTPPNRLAVLALPRWNSIRWACAAPKKGSVPLGPRPLRSPSP